MKSISLKAITSLFIFSCLTGCAIHQELVKADQAKQRANPPEVDWFDSDIKTLPIINNAPALADIASDLCNRPAPFGQKVYALRLATQASFIDRNNKKVSLVLSRIAFLVADSIDGDDDKMKKSADIGVRAARSIGLNQANPESCYYFALNQGLIVQSRGLFALNKLPEIHEALKTAQKVDNLDYGGPMRVLGMMYLRAPAWPSGIGDLDKSLELLEQAVIKYPEHPQNFMFYAMALIEDDNKDAALHNLDIAYRLAVPEIWGPYYSKKWRSEIDSLRKKISD